MESPSFHIFLTGSNRFLGKYLLFHILQYTPQHVTINLPSTDIFLKDFIQFSLFATHKIQKALRERVTVITENLKLDHLTKINTFLHCAENDDTSCPFDTLIQENVTETDSILSFIKKSPSIQKFLFLSTCYIHPTDNSTKGKSVELPKNIPQKLFNNNYTYSKYLAENLIYTFSKSNPTIQTTILRPSSLGAPTSFVNAHPSHGSGNGIHLDFLHLILSQKLLHICMPTYTSVNIIPVDLACNEIIECINNKDSKQILQICSASNNNTFNIPLQSFVASIQKNEFKHTLEKLTILPTLEQFLTSINYTKNKEFLQYAISIHQSINSIKQNPPFESNLSLPLPHISQDEYIKITFEFIKRSLHDQQFKHIGVKKTIADTLLISIPDSTIHCIVKPTKHIPLTQLEDFKDELFHAISKDRKNFSTLQNGVWKYNHSSFDITSFLTETCKSIPNLQQDLLNSYSSPISKDKSIQITFYIHDSKLSHILFKVNHIYFDGISLMKNIHSYTSCMSSIPFKILDEQIHYTPSLSVLEDLYVGISYGGWLIKDVFFTLLNPMMKKEESLDHHVGFVKYKAIPKRDSTTFTQSFLMDLVQSQTHPIRICMPCNIASMNQRMILPSSNFVSFIYQDFSPNDSKSEFHQKYKVFLSVTARWITLIFSFIFLSIFPGLYTIMTDTLDFVLSSIYNPSYTDVEGWIGIPLLGNIKSAIAVSTVKNTTFLTISSKIPKYKNLGSSLKNIWDERSKKIYEEGF